jgi:hypothetical protein
MRGVLLRRNAGPLVCLGSSELAFDQKAPDDVDPLQVGSAKKWSRWSFEISEQRPLKLPSEGLAKSKLD